MDDPFTRAGSGPQPLGGLLSRLNGLGRLLGWLTTLFQLSDEQQEQAGVYLDNRRRRERPIR
jgi:hypothetical protein